MTAQLRHRLRDRSPTKNRGAPNVPQRPATPAPPICTGQSWCVSPDLPTGYGTRPRRGLASWRARAQTAYVRCGRSGRHILRAAVSLYRNRAGSWTKTNVARHIQIVLDSRRNEEIRALKIWRRLHGLDFPSIYLELAVIRALRRRRGDLAANLIRVFEWLESEIRQVPVVDPANTANVISDDLTANEKRAIASRAAWSLQQPYWDRILW